MAASRLDSAAALLLDVTSSIPITVPELTAALLERDRFGATPITLSTITPADARKWEGGDLWKVGAHNGMIGHSFPRALARAQPESAGVRWRSWGNRVSPSLVEHHGRYYLTVLLRRSSAPAYLTRHGETWDPVPTAEVAHLLRPASLRPVQTRDFALDHIRSIRFGGQRFHVVR